MPRRGPKTPNGKAASSRNALDHGMTSEAPFIQGLEDESGWIVFRDGIVADYEPQGILEEALAQRVAVLLWRLDRVVRYEVGAITEQALGTTTDLALAQAYAQRTLSKGEIPTPTFEEFSEAVETRLIPHGSHLERILRYETHVHCMLTQTLHELEARQSRRRGEQPHLARLDISAAPS